MGLAARPSYARGRAEAFKFIYRYAYPRNGNVHNPTAYHIYVDGKYADRTLTFREAQEVVDGLADEGLRPPSRKVRKNV